MASEEDVEFGHRVFVIDGEHLARISQKAFHELYQRDNASLPQYAGKTVVVAVAFFTLAGRKPKQIVRIDTMRIKLTEAGTIDPGHRDEALRLVVNALNSGEGDAEAARDDEKVIDARRHFDKRRRAVHHPKLSGPMHKKILDALFR